MKCRLVLLCLALALLLPNAQAAGPDDQYVGIYSLIQQADSLNENSQEPQALARYREAQKELIAFQKGYPDWNPNIVSFRLNYLAEKIQGLASRVSPPAKRPPLAVTNTIPGRAVTATPSAPVISAPAAQPPTLQAQLDSARQQVRQLQADKQLLEAKLKEALSVQPAPADPQELARAQEQLQALQKENALLKVSLSQEKNRNSSVASMKNSEASQQSLKEAERKLNEQASALKTLEEEKKGLQKKLDSLIPSSWNAATLESTKKALQEANTKLTAQQQLTAQLETEKTALQERLKSSSSDARAMAALKAENEVLKQQVAAYKARPDKNAQNTSRQLAQARAQLAALQSDNEMLRLQKMALEERVKSAPGTGVVAAARSAPAASVATLTDAVRIKELEQQRDELQRKLELSVKQVYGRKGKAIALKVEEMENQLATLRARLAVFEAKQVPYTPEELALFKQPEAELSAAVSHPGKKSVKELPAGSATLVAEAQRLFSAKQYDKAEQNYLKVLSRDQKNVPTLANLAVIQIEMKHLDEAEKTIKQALAVEPDDAYSLTVLGQVKFRQENYDQALDALSRAAKIDPQNAQVQNLLGLTLSQKGMRVPAETALRRALQLDPNYADAHNNLAVIYVTQKPPLLELARWHYQRALAAGNPPNPFLEKALEARKTADRR